MFSSTGLFSQIPCPVEDVECSLLTCPFLHKEDASQRVWLHMPADESYTDAAPKRQKVFRQTLQYEPASTDSSKKLNGKAFVGTLIPQNRLLPAKNHVKQLESDIIEETDSETDEKPIPPSAQRRISPPPLRRRSAAKHGNRTLQSISAKHPPESLNPRLLQQDPAGHQARLLYLKKLHEGITRLNEEILKSEDPATRQLALTDDELITVALDEEQKIAKENYSVYANVIKLRMVQYRKMTVDEWKGIRLGALKAKNESRLGKIIVNGSMVTRARPLNSGLLPAEEVEISRRLLASQDGLQKYGYQIALPTHDEISKAEDGVNAAQGWEECERCKSRFQVYPDRREDGALTSGGSCTYHWGRMVRPKRERVDRVTGSSDTLYTCCKEALGSPGCVTAETHVFKVYHGPRLASVMQYEKTPENPNVQSNQAVAFDCEMGFTVKGFELIRLTAITWPEGRDLLDVLVRPFGTLLDLNSRWSGIWPEIFMNALPWDEEYQKAFLAKAENRAGGGGTSAEESPRIVDSPMVARSLLFRFISPTTPLIGHGIENDLNAARIVHPSVIDTILLYPHPRGMPYRMGLKALVKEHLWRDIQTEGASGHDSREDAKATGDLVRLRVIQIWDKMRKDGWKLENDVFNEPVKGAERVIEASSLQEGTHTGEKRPLPLDYD